MTDTSSLRPNIIKCVCAAGTVEHGWHPVSGEGYASMSVPSGICLAFTRHFGCLVTIGGKRSQRDVERGCVQIAGPEPIYWHVVHEPADVVEVTATKEVRHTIAAELGVPQAADLADLDAGNDCVVWAIAARLRTSLRTPGQGARQEYEELIWSLYGHIFATRLGGRPAAKGLGKLDRRRFDRVTTYVEEHLSDSRLTVAALAEVASMSPFHFLRSFQRTLHMTPHQYVRARRLERIKTALANGTDLQEEASNYGFRHIRHFQSAYCRHHGIAPGRELREVLLRSGKQCAVSDTETENLEQLSGA